jgi:hypothetical protein
MRPFSNACAALAFATVLATLGGCSEYTDRRELISIKGGDALQTDKVTQMVDPWPRESANRDIAYDGVVMQGAVERYHTGRVIVPNNAGTSTAYQSAPQNNATPLAPSESQPTAPVK